MISNMRKKGKSFFSILAKPFILLKINPNHVSLLAIPLALIFAFFIYRQNFLPAFIFGTLALLMDGIDGEVARGLNKCTNFGVYIEGIIDKIVDFILLGAFIPLFPIAAALAMGFSFLASFAKPRVALVIITDNRDWKGIGERGDKFALLLAGTFVSAFIPIVFGFPTIEFFILLVALIAAIGFVQRVYYAKDLIIEAEKKGALLPYLKKPKNKG